MAEFKRITSVSAINEKSRHTENLKEVFRKIQVNQHSEKDLYNLCLKLGNIDEEVSMETFGILTKRMGFDLSQHRIQEIFAHVKSQDFDEDNLRLNEEEFSEALRTVRESMIWTVMEALGITREILYFYLTLLVILLLAFFGFLFLGIQAFSVGGSFSAVINSLLTAGGAMFIGKDDKKEEKSGKEHVEKACKENLPVSHDHDDAQDIGTAAINVKDDKNEKKGPPEKK